MPFKKLESTNLKTLVEPEPPIANDCLTHIPPRGTLKTYPPSQILNFLKDTCYYFHQRSVTQLNFIKLQMIFNNISNGSSVSSGARTAAVDEVGDFGQLEF
jgi:hypothetical protein